MYTQVKLQDGIAATWKTARFEREHARLTAKVRTVSCSILPMIAPLLFDLITCIKSQTYVKNLGCGGRLWKSIYDLVTDEFPFLVWADVAAAIMVKRSNSKTFN